MRILRRISRSYGVAPLLTLLIGVPALAGCAGAPAADAGKSPGGPGFPVRVESCGFTTEVTAEPTRAVTMNQGATEIALALGVEDQLAGTAYLDDEVAPRWRDAYDQVDVLAKEYPQHEVFLQARPDLVIASYASAFDAEAAGSRKSLAADGVASYLSPFACAESSGDAPVSFESVWGEVADVATLFGVPERAERLETEQRAALDALAEERAGAGLDVFWFDSGDKTAFAVGARNVFASVAGGWSDVNWEKVVAADPDVIVLADASWSTAEEKIDLLKDDPVLSQLQAVRNDAFVTIPFSESTPGVRLADGAGHVAEQLGELNQS
jgi:iron complex transport system substrate-binding protein